MLNKVLVALDGSELAETALPYAIEFSKRYGAELDLVSVSVEKDSASSRLLTSYLSKLVEGIREEGATARPVLLYGSAAEAIADYAERNQISLVTITTRGLSGLTRWVMGSTAEKLVRSSGVPLLVIKAESAAKTPRGKVIFKRILVPLDGSEVGEAALPLAIELATRLGAQLLLFQAIPRVYEVAVTVDYVPGYPEQVISNLREAAVKYLAGVKTKLGEKGVNSLQEIRIGNPAEEILNYVAEAKVDVIAMSTHGRSGISRWVLGSNAEKVMRAAKVPVLLVRGKGVKEAKTTA